MPLRSSKVPPLRIAATSEGVSTFAMVVSVSVSPSGSAYQRLHLHDTAPTLSPITSLTGYPSARSIRAGGCLPHLRDHPEGLVAPRHPLHVVEGVPEGLGPVLPGRPRRVRREGDVLEAEERMVDERRLLDHDVEPRRGDLLREQRVAQGLLVHDGAAAGVDEDGVLLHHRELARAHHLAC